MQRAVTPAHRAPILSWHFAAASRYRPSSPGRSRYILLICYDFPHNYAAGVIRTYQFAKELLALGWQPVILTAQPRTDSDYNIEISDGALDCAKISAPEMRWRSVLGANHRASHTIVDRPATDENTFKRSFRRFGTRLVIPDGKVSWLYPAVKRAREILRLYPISICLSVSPRPTTHLVGYRLARRLNVPWVADFALPWSDAYWLADRPRAIQWLDQRVEGFVVRSAQHITVAYPELARRASARFGQAAENKTAVIPTGFDEGLFAQERSTPATKFTVVYPGNHFCEIGRAGEYFLKAIDEWLDLEPNLEDKIECIFIGKRDDELLLQQAGMRHSQVIRMEGMVSHRACIQTVLSSSLCIVNTVGNRIPAKVYECMAAGKWILALTNPATDLAAIVRHYSKGMVVSARNISAIRQALRDIWRRCHSGTVEAMGTDTSLDRYSARYSVGLLSNIFDQLLLNKQKTKPLTGRYEASSIR
jgi:Glycosyl transferase 4-like domain/Glycosyl transferases group 1